MKVTISKNSDNSQFIQIGKLGLYFSYETIVGFDDVNGERVFSENVWSVTTGKHLTQFGSDKKERIKNVEFEVKLKAILDRLEVNG